MWQLVINGPGYFETAYELPEGVTHIGRADENEVVLSGDLVSRTHVRLIAREQTLHAEDMGSRNGSFLNSEPLLQKQALQSGDVLVVGENTLTVQKAKAKEHQETELVALGDAFAGEPVTVAFSQGLQDSRMRRLLDNFSGIFADELLKNAANIPFFQEGESSGPLPSPERPTDSQWRSLVTMYQVAESLAQAQSLDHFLEHACQLVLQRLEASVVTVLQPTTDGTFTPKAVCDQRTNRSQSALFSQSIVATAIKQAQAIAVLNAKQDPRFSQKASILAATEEQVLCIPIGAQPSFSAVLYVRREQHQGDALEAVLDVCTAIAQLVSTGITRFGERISMESRLRLGLEHHFSSETASRLLTELRTNPARLETFREISISALTLDVVWNIPPNASLGAAWKETFRILAHVIRSFDGTLGASVGNRFTAWFEAGQNTESHAIRAVRAGLALEAAWNRVLGSSRAFDLRMGIATGVAVSGLVVDGGRLEPLAVGEATLVAGFLCDTAEPKQILVCGKTLALLGARFDTVALGQKTPPAAWTAHLPATSVFEITGEDDGIRTMPGAKTSG
jgi:adenylate cyclase